MLMLNVKLQILQREYILLKTFLFGLFRLHTLLSLSIYLGLLCCFIPMYFENHFVT